MVFNLRLDKSNNDLALPDREEKRNSVYFPLLLLACLVDLTLIPTCLHSRAMRKTLNEEVIKDMMGEAALVSELELEWKQLQEDRLSLRQV